MSEEKNNSNDDLFNEGKPNVTPQLPDGIENAEENENLTAKEIQEQLENIQEEEVPEKEEISDKDLRKLVKFTRNIDDLTQEELDSLRNDDEELEKLLKISMLKAKVFTFHPKKKFGLKYKQKRKRKNHLAKQSRIANRR